MQRLTLMFCIGVIGTAFLQVAAGNKVKRQSNLAPTFSQSSYYFNVPSCTQQTSFGAVTAISSSSGSQIAYTVDDISASSRVLMGVFTGVMALSSNAPSTLTFNVRASNNFGSTVVPVTITCSGGAAAQPYFPTTYPNSVPTNPYVAVPNTAQTYPYGTSQTYPYTAAQTYPYGTAQTYPYNTAPTYPYNTAPTYPYNTAATYPYNTAATYPYNTAATYPYNMAATYPYNTASTYPYSTLTNPYTSLTYPYGTSNPYPYGTSNTYPYNTYPYNTGTTTNTALTFGQTSYSLTSTSCTAGSLVGSVYSSAGTSTGNTYVISGGTGQFAVSPAGQISLLTAVPAGTYSLTVTATGVYGTASVPVTVTITCGTSIGTGATGTVTGNGVPVWIQNFYAFTLSTCTASGTTVGSVSATNAVSYSINQGNSQFTINSSGVISATGTLTNGSVNGLTVVARSSAGIEVAIPVTVTVSC